MFLSCSVQCSEHPLRPAGHSDRVVLLCVCVCVYVISSTNLKPTLPSFDLGSSTTEENGGKKEKLF